MKWFMLGFIMLALSISLYVAWPHPEVASYTVQLTEVVGP